MVGKGFRAEANGQVGILKSLDGVRAWREEFRTGFRRGEEGKGCGVLAIWD